MKFGKHKFVRAEWMIFKIFLSALIIVGIVNFFGFFGNRLGVSLNVVIWTILGLIVLVLVFLYYAVREANGIKYV